MLKDDRCLKNYITIHLYKCTQETLTHSDTLQFTYVKVCTDMQVPVYILVTKINSTRKRNQQFSNIEKMNFKF